MDAISREWDANLASPIQVHRYWMFQRCILVAVHDILDIVNKGLNSNKEFRDLLEKRPALKSDWQTWSGKLNQFNDRMKRLRNSHAGHFDLELVRRHLDTVVSEGVLSIESEPTVDWCAEVATLAVIAPFSEDDRRDDLLAVKNLVEPLLNLRMIALDIHFDGIEWAPFGGR